MFKILSLLQNIIVDFVTYVLSMVDSHEMNVVLVHIHVMNNVMYFLYLMSMTSWGSFSLCVIKFFSIGFNEVDHILLRDYTLPNAIQDFVERPTKNQRMPSCMFVRPLCYILPLG